MTPEETKAHDTGSGFAGQFLIAMPSMQDERFERSVIYLCAHSDEGAMGLVVNKPMTSITFPDLLGQLGIEAGDHVADNPVLFGGPVESGRGFVLHSADFIRDASMRIADDVALTATIDILKAISAGEGPHRHVLTLGYAGWDAGQLDAELQSNGWLVAPSDDAILFDHDWSTKWERAIRVLGVDAFMLSGEAGHA
ncbi:YqgE/AlgH family protein [Fodinicurvata sp. EGI_FJ10296]|uniref:YqgE/AlgH family protein n=1 Tax=Fodinicurvata sp. EGI_FJ10296 TaxID=3231908 RepID=UPI003456AC55